MTSESIATTPNAKRKSALVEKFNSFVHSVRAMSADRIRSASQNRGIPTLISRVFLYKINICILASNNLGLNGSNTNGSQSDLSGVSSASNKTYITEESSMILECIEKGVTK